MNELRLLSAAVACAVLLLGAAPVEAQQGTIVGAVTAAATGAPVSGAEVTLIGAGARTLTNEEGRYVLQGVEPGRARVRVSILGFAPQVREVTVAPGGTAVADFALADQAIQLDQIVVTGTAGDARARTLGNAVARVDAAEVVAQQPVNSVQELLNGRAPGVVMTAPTGMVGAGSKIWIRGISSLSLSTQPLLYVDGVRVDNAETSGPAVQYFGTPVSRINDINPEDIESIEVIKGPAAATLYGTEASNGVIQIITKKGAGLEPRFDLKIRQGANWFANPEGRLPVTYWRNPATGDVETLNIVEHENRFGPAPLFRTGRLQGYDLSLGGAEGKVRYYLSGSYDRSEGAERDNVLTRWAGRANLTVLPSDRLEVTGTLGYTTSDAGLSHEGSWGGLTWAAWYASPARLTLSDGSPHPLRGFVAAPPEIWYDAWQSSQEVGRFTGSIRTTHRTTDWLTQRLTFGIDRTVEDNQTLEERSEEFQTFFGTLRGFKEAGRRDAQYNTVDYSGTVDLSLGDALSSSTSLGAQYYHRLTEFVSAYGEDFPAPGLTVVEAAAIQRGSEDYVENSTVGVYVQQQIGWRDRLFLTAGLRADDNSAFGEAFDLVYYPKVSASWVLSDEPFWTVPAVNTLRLRAAYGESGQQPAAFDALRTYAPTTGRGDVAAITPATAGNAELGPERGKEIELGFDASFLAERVGLQFTYYHKRTIDGIVNRSIAPSTGFAGSQFVNIGEIRNSGIELLLDGKVVERPNLDLNLSFSFATNDNEVLELGAGLDRLVYSSQFGLESRVGHPAISFFHKRILSAQVNPDGTTSNLMCDGGPGAAGPVPCAEAPAVYLGRVSPKYEGAFTSTLRLFERLRLSALIDYKTGHHKWDGTTWVRCSIFALCRENVFPQEADPVLLATYQRGLEIQSPYIRDAGFVSLREVAAGYTIPDTWAARLGAASASISVAARNLYRWTDWPGLDPEVAFHGASPGGGWYEQNNLPQLAQFVTTINLGF